MSIFQRITDYLRERRIQRLRQQFAAAYAVADRRQVHVVWRRLQDEINDRSPDQVKRMEQQRGIHRA